MAAVDDTDDLREILAAAAVLAGAYLSISALDAAVAAGLVTFDGLHVRFRHPLVRSGVVPSETVTRRQAASLALARVLVEEPYRRTCHRAQAVGGQDDAVADELEELPITPPWSPPACFPSSFSRYWRCRG